MKNSSSFLTPLVVSLSLALSISLVGCSKQETKTNAETSKPKSNVSSESNVTNTTVENETTSNPDNATTDSQAAAQALTRLMLGDAAVTTFMRKASGELDIPMEAVTCMYSNNDKLPVDEIQAFLNKTFSSDEMMKINQFYQSSTGNTQIQMFELQIQQVIHPEKKQASTMQLSKKDENNILAFWKTVEGEKLGNVLQSKDKILAAMNPIIEKKKMDCKVTS